MKLARTLLDAITTAPNIRYTQFNTTTIYNAYLGQDEFYTWNEVIYTSPLPTQTYVVTKYSGFPTEADSASPNYLGGTVSGFYMYTYFSTMLPTEDPGNGGTWGYSTYTYRYNSTLTYFIRYTTGYTTYLTGRYTTWT